MPSHNNAGSPIMKTSAGRVINICYSIIFSYHGNIPDERLYVQDNSDKNHTLFLLVDRSGAFVLTYSHREAWIWKLGRHI